MCSVRAIAGRSSTHRESWDGGTAGMAAVDWPGESGCAAERLTFSRLRFGLRSQGRRPAGWSQTILKSPSLTDARRVVGRSGLRNPGELDLRQSDREKSKWERVRRAARATRLAMTAIEPRSQQWPAERYLSPCARAAHADEPNGPCAPGLPLRPTLPPHRAVLCAGSMRRSCERARETRAWYSTTSECNQRAAVRTP